MKVILTGHMPYSEYYLLDGNLVSVIILGEARLKNNFPFSPASRLSPKPSVAITFFNCYFMLLSSIAKALCCKRLYR